MTFLRYPAYKDSGVAWLGEIPSQWEIKPIKHVVTCNDEVLGESTPPNTELRYIEISDVSETQGVTNVQSIIFEDAPSRARRITQTGDIIISTVRTYLKAIAKIDYSLEGVIVSTGFAVLRPQNGVDVGFLSHAMRAPHFLDMVVAHSVGISYPAINTSDLIGFKLPFPPLPEQHAIAAFLDTETARIDTLVAKQVSLIATLQEKRRALISHVVTKGLDPAAPMKDSGVLWLGEVPKHWEVKAIKWLSPVQRGASPRPIDDPKYFDDEGEYAWVRIADVTAAEDGYLRITTQRLSPLGSSLSVKLDPGALFLSIAGSVGKPCISCIKACIHDGFVYFPHLRENNKFLFYIFEAGTAFQGLGKLGTQLNLNTDTVGSIRIGVPPKVEQDAIVAFIERESDRVDTLITKSQEMIAVLREHRTALVAAAVTGQIDVREPSRESGRIK